MIKVWGGGAGSEVAIHIRQALPMSDYIKTIIALVPKKVFQSPYTPHPTPYSLLPTPFAITNTIEAILL